MGGGSSPCPFGLSAVAVEWLEHRTPRLLTMVCASSNTTSFKADKACGASDWV